MQRCSKCNAPLNEFDVSFHQALFKKKDTDRCRCFSCTTTKEQKDFFSIREKKHKLFPQFWVHFIPLAFFATFMIFGFFEDWNWNGGLVCFLIGFLAAFPICGGLSARGMDLYFGETGAHYEIKAKSNGIFEATKVSEHDDDTVVLVFFIIFWYVICIPHWIYVICKTRIDTALEKKKLRKHCTTKMIDAYDFAATKCLPAVITQKQQEQYNKVRKTFCKNAKQKQDSCSKIGENEVKARKNIMQPPYISLKIQEQDYIYVKQDRNGKYLLRRAKNNAICGAVAVRGYWLYSTAPNWKIEWDELNGAGSAEKAVKTYAQFL